MKRWEFVVRDATKPISNKKSNEGRPGREISFTSTRFAEENRYHVTKLKMRNHNTPTFPRTR